MSPQLPISLFQVQRAGNPGQIPVQMRNKAQPQMMMKAITGAKARYASYDQQIQPMTGEFSGSNQEQMSQDDRAAEKPPGLVFQRSGVSPEQQPSIVTFHPGGGLLSNRMTGTFDHKEDSSQQLSNLQLSIQQHSNQQLTRQQMSLEERPASKVEADQEMDFVSDGVSEVEI